MIVRPEIPAPARPELRPPLVAPALKRRLFAWRLRPRRGWSRLLSSFSKYAHHLPRRSTAQQEHMSARWGAKLSRKTMADWVGGAADWFRPIYLRDEGGTDQGSPYLQADETPVRCRIRTKAKQGKPSSAGSWAISFRPGDDVVFSTGASSRKHEKGGRHALGRFCLVCSRPDGYQAYAPASQKITRALSVSDALRTHAAGFHEALDMAPVAAGFHACA